jgi:ABC-type branched-subunit amino acid transport system substrate-binding protein
VIALLAVSFVPEHHSTPAASAPAGLVSGAGQGGAQGAPGADEAAGAAGGGGAGAAGSLAAGARRGGAAGGGEETGALAPGGAAGALKLTASDVGVTADSVKVGFLIVNLAGLNATGQALGLRGDISQVVDAYVAEVNRLGGINGRKVVAVKRPTDTTNQGDGIAACTYMLKDQKVFGVIDTFGAVYEAVQRCFSLDGHAPFSHSYVLSESFQAAGKGMDVAALLNLDRQARTWSLAAKEKGFIKGGEKVGVITDTCEPSHSVVDKVLVPGIKAAGAASVKTVLIDCDTGSQTSQVPNAVLQLKTAGVTHVFPAVSFVAATNFFQNADAQAWKPKYFLSDFYGLTTDLFSKNFSPNQMNGVRAVTTTYSGWQAAGKGVPPGAQVCSDALTRHGVPGITDINTDAEALGLCDQFLDIFVAGAKKAGPNLTRVGWAQAVQQLGRIQLASNDTSVFGPGKFSGGDSVADIEWRADCPYGPYRPRPCWVALGGYRPGYA